MATCVQFSAATELTTDVLVLGGGPAGLWAAISAAASGSRVTLADKGFCGYTGPCAHRSTMLSHIPTLSARTVAAKRWSATGEFLGDPDWMFRVMEATHRQIKQLTQWGYLFHGDGIGFTGRTATLFPDFLRLLRRRALAVGVRILDHHPALRLLVDDDGVVSGASGIVSADGYRSWQVLAHAVVVATGGCAFAAGSAGTDGNTGDGLLMSAEVGAALSGMEFSAGYGLAAVGRARSIVRPEFETLYDDAGEVIAEGEVFATLARGARVLHRPVDGRGPVPLRPVLEGTVRGTGGLRIVGSDCATTAPGLYVAGDAATREAITGATSGVDGQHGAWAMASGAWAGLGAARFARGRGGVGRVRVLPGAGLNARGYLAPHAVVGLVQEHTVPLRRSYWRSQAVLRDSVAELNDLWPGAVHGLGGVGPDLLRAREAAALLAVARWSTHSALARTESRGLHRRVDHPVGAPRWRIRLETGGLDDVWVRAGDRLPGRTA